MFPKILVISNECFSKISSNGRTLGNFFANWPKECLCQFYLSGTPDFDYCAHFFSVSDKQALNAIKGSDNIGGVVSSDAFVNVSKPSVKENKKCTVRNAMTMLARNAVWKTGAWKKSGYEEWVESFRPDVVLLQAGDCAFMYDIAVWTAKRSKAKLVLYNSEAYYYKKFDYFRGAGIAHAVYPLFRKQLCRALEKAYAMADCVIYICDELREAYAKDFSGRAETVFTGSDIAEKERQKTN